MDKLDISPYRKTLFSISRELDAEEIGELNFLCKDNLTASQREDIKNARTLFDILEKKKIIAEDNFSFLIDRLGDLGRDDLKQKLKELLLNDEGSRPSNGPSSQAQHGCKAHSLTDQDTAGPAAGARGMEAGTAGIAGGLTWGTNVSTSGATVNYTYKFQNSPGNTYSSGQERSSPTTKSQTRHQRADPAPKNGAEYQDTGSRSRASQQGQSFGQPHPKPGTLKTPADFSPNVLQTRPVGAADVSQNDRSGIALPCNRQQGGMDDTDAATKTLESNAIQALPTTEMKGARMNDIPILDWPNVMTPHTPETPPGGENSSMKKAARNPDGSSQSQSLFEGNVETDEPQVLQAKDGDASLTNALHEDLASLLLQGGDTPSSDTVPTEALMDTLNEGAQLSAMNNANTTSEEYDGTGPEEAAGASEVGGQVILRNYQHELAYYPLTTRDNYIICAPTGSGKTLTAASICYEKYIKFQASKAVPGKYFKALFIVNIRHLTQQQKNAFQEYFPNGLAVRSIGEQQPFEYALMKDEPMPVVLMLTAQILVNALRQKTVTLQDLDMLIFDECHHTDLLHPYNVIMKTYLKQKTTLSRGIGEHVGCLPQVIGLSASLGVGRGQDPLGHVLKLCANMDVRNVIRVRKHKKQLDEFVKAPDQDAIISVPPRVTTKRHFGGLLEGIMGEIEDQLGDTAKNSLPCHGSQPYENEVISRQETSSRHEDIIVYKYLNVYNRALMLYEDLPVQDCLETLEEFYKSRSFSQNREATDVEQLCRHLFDSNLDEMRRMAREGGDNNQKLQELIKLLAAQFAKSPASKGIVLTRMKVATIALCHFIRSSPVLKQLPRRIRPERLVGQGTLDEQSMTENEQRMILENFRQENGCNVLVATDIAQEGLDMPACNFVIRYNFVSNEIGTVQSKGRARAVGSQCYLIVESGSANEQRELENRQKVKSMEKAMSDLEAMGEDERLNSIKEKLRELIATMLEAERQEQLRAAKIRETAVTLLCAECKQPVCTSSDLRRKGAGGYVTCINPELEERVTDVTLEYSPTRYRDTQSVCKIMCGNPVCKNQLGTREMFFLQSESEGFSLRAKSFIAQYPQGGQKRLKKWKELTIIEDENL